MIQRKKIAQHPLVRFLSSIKITVTCLSLLFLLTFCGTIDQSINGLFHAQETFFHSFIFLAFGFLPFPGAQLVLWILFINLVTVALVRFPIRWSHIGILIIHFGLLTYFIAAFVTLHGVQESNMTLLEGDGRNVSSAYHDWELSVWERDGLNKKVIAFDANDFKKDQTLPYDDFGLKVRVLLYYPNSRAFNKGEPTSGLDVVNDSGIGSIQSVTQNKEPEKNLPGAIFQFVSDDGTESRLLLYGGEANPTRIYSKGNVYYVQLRRKRYVLPLTLKLIDFKKELHPRTDVARSFQSFVQVIINGVARDAVISMNKPLRYKNYTFYQASYMIDELGREHSTLAVVRNSGRLLPYIASFLTFFGLLVHFLGSIILSKFISIKSTA